MKAVILAAGFGSRMGSLVKDKPKCLLELRPGFTILDYQIKCLKNVVRVTYQDIFIVGGYKIETLKPLGEKDINIIFNSKYKEYENIYSFHLIKNRVNDAFILLNSDTLFHHEILESVVKARDGTYFVVDNARELGKEEMKVIIKNSRIIKFGKDIPLEEADGEYIGVAKFNPNDAKKIFEKIEDLIKCGKTNLWYEYAINYVLNDVKAMPIYTHGLPWIEVDTPQDYERAKLMSGDFHDLQVR